MQIYSIETGYFKLDGGAMFGVVPKSIWNKSQPADENNLCSWAMRCLLIEDGKSLILVDTGIGDKQSEKFFSHYYLHGDDTLDKSLAKHGFTRNDITDVLLTHLHFDHVGGAVVRSGEALLPAFRNATYWSNEAHWKHATIPNPREKASFLEENIIPVMKSGRLRFVDAPDKGHRSTFAPGIDLVFVNGHTESMMLPLIDYKGHKILYCADLFPSISHLPLPYVMGYDIRPLDTLLEKERTLKEAAANDVVLFFEHDPKIECCTVMQTEKGIRENEVFKLRDL
ncbi:MAG: MBL fold metallo-hydrolase [Flavitalea sp.]